MKTLKNQDLKQHECFQICWKFHKSVIINQYVPTKPNQKTPVLISTPSSPFFLFSCCFPFEGHPVLPTDRVPPPPSPPEARLPGFLVPALTLSSSSSVVDAAAEMVTLVEERPLVVVLHWMLNQNHRKL